MITSITERLAKNGELATFKAVVESLENPEHFCHEEIFTWHSKRTEAFLQDLLELMSFEERLEAEELFEIGSFDFAAAKLCAIKANFRSPKEVPSVYRGLSFYLNIRRGSNMLRDDFEDARTI